MQTGPRVSHGFPSTLQYDYKTKLCRQQAEGTKFMYMQMFATSENVKADTENIRGLSLAAVKHTTVQVTRPPLYIPYIHMYILVLELHVKL
jgi:hypothetical protein